MLELENYPHFPIFSRMRIDPRIQDHTTQRLLCMAERRCNVLANVNFRYWTRSLQTTLIEQSIVSSSVALFLGSVAFKPIVLESFESASPCSYFFLSSAWFKGYLTYAQYPSMEILSPLCKKCVSMDLVKVPFVTFFFYFNSSCCVLSLAIKNG